MIVKGMVIVGLLPGAFLEGESGNRRENGAGRGVPKTSVWESNFKIEKDSSLGAASPLVLLHFEEFHYLV
jgi:hypothetical protein